MKIALVVPGGVDRSGTDRVIPVLLWLIERLVRAGDEVHVFALDQEPEPADWELLGARVRNAGRRPRRLRLLRSLMREHRRGAFNVVHAFWAGAPGQVAMAFAAISRVPLVVTLPGGDLAALPDIGYGAQLKLRSRIATRMVLSRASAILAPSEWLTRQAASLGWKAIHCPFGVALDRWPPAEPQRRSPGVPLRLIHVATLNRVKDPFALLEAVRLLAQQDVDFTLDLFGADTLGGTVQRHCASLGLGERVTFHGFIGNDQLRQHLERADLLVMSSRHEGAPIVLLEAAAAGIPTAGTEVGCIADWAPEATIAVPVGDPAALAEAIAGVAGNEDERMRLARAAHARALDYNADDYAARVRSIYAEVTAR